MTDVPQGEAVTLLSQWFEFSGGPAADLLTTPTVRVIRLSDNANVVPQTSVGVNHPTTGVYTYSWQVLSEAVLGDHLVVWNGTDAASGAVTANEVVTVVPGVSLVETWATPAEAASILGNLVQTPMTQADLSGANGIVEIYVGVVPAARARLSRRDLGLLKKAESYQAAWMSGQVDLASRSDVDLVSQDGLQYSKADKDTHVLGPLATASVRRLSWMRTRTMDPLTPAQALALRGVVTAETIGTYGGDSDLEDDPYHPWRAM